MSYITEIQLADGTVATLKDAMSGYITSSGSCNYATSAGSATSASSAAKLTTARTLTIGSTGKSFDGSGNVSWSLSEIGAAASSHSHSNLVTEGDNRSTATTPDDYSNNFKFRGLKSNSTIGSPSSDTYSYLLGLRGWSDSSGGNSWELAFNNSNISVRNGSTTSWNSWQTLITSSNIGSQSVSYATQADSASTATSATSASQLGATSKGSATQPVYFSNGIPAACTYTLSQNVPSDAVFTDYKVSSTNITSTTGGGLFYIVGTTSQSSSGQQGYSNSSIKGDYNGILYASNFLGATHQVGSSSAYCKLTYSSSKLTFTFS